MSGAGPARPLRALVVSNMYPGRDPGYPYVGNFVAQQVEALRRHARVEVDVLCIDGFRGAAHYLAGYARAWWRVLVGGHDVVHIHYGLTAAFVAALPAGWRRRCIVTLHGGDILPGQGKAVQVAITRRVIGQVAEVVAVSEEIAREARAAARRVTVLPCGIDEGFFSPAPAPGARGCPAGPVRLVFPGNPARPVKNHALFERVLDAYRRESGPAQPRVLHMMTGEQVRDTLREADAMVLTSVSEGSPQVVKEALATDLAVVAADVGDVRALLGRCPGTAVFARDDDPAAIARQVRLAIAQARETPGERRRHLRGLGLGERDTARRIAALYRTVGRDG